MEVTQKATFNVEKIRSQFPILNRTVHGKPLVYFDNGASSQKPKVVIDAISKYYSNDNANIHRGVHFLSQEATTMYESSRNKIQNYLNAKHSHEVIFTKGTTDGINLLAFSFGELLQPGDEIIISAMEHHSNIVPWQMLCERKKTVLRVVPINSDGDMIMDEFDKILSSKTKLVAVVHISNALGTINPIEEIISKSHAVGAKVMIDAAQTVQHMKIDVQKLNCDFMVFSTHKMFGPTGVGILYGKEELLNAMPPYQGGGDMIAKVTFKKTTYNELPFKFEAGTPNIAGVIGTGAAIDFILEQDFDEIHAHELHLMEYAKNELLKIERLKIIGTAKNKASVISFIIDGIHHFDLGTLLDQQGIAVRTGHHCAQPVMEFFEISGTIRVSFAFYNTIEEVDSFLIALKRGVLMLS